MGEIKYGFNLEKEKAERTETDYVFGGNSPFKVDAGFVENIKMYLPIGELQNIGEEKIWCATASVLNILETKFNYLRENNLISKENLSWLEEKGYIDFDYSEFRFSDVFIAIKSGTTRQGNSLKAPLQAVRHFGIIPKSLLPQLETWDDNYNPKRITKEIEELGYDFLERFDIGYDIIYKKDFKEFIKGEMLDVGLHGWSNPVNGIYPRTEEQFNHAVCIFPPTEYEAFDNYLDSIDNDFIKKLSSDYKLLDYAYRIIITEKKIQNWTIDIPNRIMMFIKLLIKKIKKDLTYSTIKRF